VKASPPPPSRDTPHLKLQHLQRQTHKGSAADKFYHTPSRTDLISDSHSAAVALKHCVSQTACSEQTTLACFPQLPAARCAEMHTGPTYCVSSSCCINCFLLALCPGLTGRGKSIFYEQNSYFVTSKTNPVLQFYCLHTKLSTAPVQTSHC